MVAAVDLGPSICYNYVNPKMKMLTRFTVLLFATLSFASSAFAAPRRVPTRTEIQQHNDLVQVVRSTGTQVFVNHPVCEDTGADGMYYAGPNVLVICQDNAKQAKKFDGKEVAWTYNDLDTIRHEAQHMIQDCVAGFHNGNLKPMFSDDERAEFARAALGDDMVNRIAYTYSRNGASREVIELEFEAFSVAAVVAPYYIAEAVVKACPTPFSKS